MRGDWCDVNSRGTNVPILQRLRKKVGTQNTVIQVVHNACQQGLAG